MTSGNMLTPVEILTASGRGSCICGIANRQENGMKPGPRRITVGTVVLDDIDIRMLIALQDDGRITKSQLADRVNLSNSACFERMRRLEGTGVIESYHARINVLKLGDPQLIQTHLNLSSHRSGDFQKFERWVLDEEMIVECYALGGGIDYTITVCALRIADYQELIDKMLDADLGVERYYTYIVTKKVKQNEVRIENLVNAV